VILYDIGPMLVPVVVWQVRLPTAISVYFTFIFTNSCSSASEVANRTIISVVKVREHSPLNTSRVCLITISARMFNKYGERTQPDKKSDDFWPSHHGVYCTATLGFIVT